MADVDQVVRNGRAIILSDAPAERLLARLIGTVRHLDGDPAAGLDQCANTGEGCDGFGDVLENIDERERAEAPAPCFELVRVQPVHREPGDTSGEGGGARVQLN